MDGQWWLANPETRRARSQALEAAQEISRSPGWETQPYISGDVAFKEILSECSN